MCRILFSLGKPPRDILLDFVQVSRRDRTMGWSHGSGWGALWTRPGSYGLYKSIRPIWEDYVEPPDGYILYILHSRLASVGEPTLENTHPIVRGRYAIAHNGTIDRERYKAALREEGVEVGELDGSTDSELLLKAIIALGGDETAVRKAAKLAKPYLDPQEPVLNFVFVDLAGLAIFYTYRGSEHPHFVPVEKDGIIASEPLGQREGWKPLENGKTVVVKF
ncbi:glutamine amidotransferase-like protein [Pyrobaculum islandicum DSM 4184]|uniref:Glutamine amidotransferase-like protein n=1 Tax=Pyrobaculum islandicum (strain DSM 4184 / JCM 9189 / GEO3) TaxID=384616 RepID=A1RQU4_PYRIL|nr:class II glutamine amidotransferase [Pyrobaculum islandicum]ABL87326.1 glutamine amidotransferase-like protein [Pyrobaculum islandicum DSM 4184]